MNLLVDPVLRSVWAVAIATERECYGGTARRALGVNVGTRFYRHCQIVFTGSEYFGSV